MPISQEMEFLKKHSMQKIHNLPNISLVIALYCGFIFFIHMILPHDAHAQNQLLVLYSGNVIGEIEGCG
jgi:hypothetical protein